MSNDYPYAKYVADAKRYPVPLTEEECIARGGARAVAGAVIGWHGRGDLTIHSLLELLEKVAPD